VAIEYGGHHLAGFLPTPAHGSDRQPQRFGRGLSISPEIPEQLEDFLIFLGKTRNRRVKLLPVFEREFFFETVTVVFGLVYAKYAAVGAIASKVRVVVLGVAHRPGMFTGEVNKLPLYLRRHQVHGPPTPAAARCRPCWWIDPPRIAKIRPRVGHRVVNEPQDNRAFAIALHDYGMMPFFALRDAGTMACGSPKIAMSSRQAVPPQWGFVLMALVVGTGFSHAVLAQEKPAGALDSLLETVGEPSAEENDAKEARRPVPDQPALDEAATFIKQAFEEELKDSSSDPGVLIDKFVDLSNRTDDAARKFVLLLLAESAATRAGRVSQSMDLIAARAQSFEIDELQERLNVLSKAAKRPADAPAAVYEHAIETAVQAVDAERLELATAAAEIAVVAAKSVDRAEKPQGNDAVRGRDATAAASPPEAGVAAKNLLKNIGLRKKLLAGFEAARATLQDEPDNAAAAETVGKYLCFVKGDWTKGLQALSKCSDKELRSLASRETELLKAPNPDAKQLFTLAGDWWKLATAGNDLPSHEVACVQRHASDLYSQIMNQLSDPIELTLANKRIAIVTDGAKPSAAASVQKQPEKALFLADLPEFNASVGYGKFGKNGDLGYENLQIVVAGQRSLKGISMAPPHNGSAFVTYRVPKGSGRFVAIAALNDSSQVKGDPVTFRVLSERGKVLWSTKKPLLGPGESEDVDIPLTGVSEITLVVQCSGNANFRHAVWVDPRFVAQGVRRK
jgi:hypothetical protein